MTKKPLYIFLHTPKCAGTTVVKHLVYFAEKESYLHLWVNSLPDGIKTNKEYTEKQILSIPKEKRDKIKILIGHNVYYGIDKLFPNREPRYITFLRNPVKIKFSSYNYGRTRLNKKESISADDYNSWKRNLIKNNKIITFEEFFSHKSVPNYMSMFLVFAFLKRMIHNGMIHKIVDADLNNEDIKEIKRALNKFYFVGILENPKDLLFLYFLFKIDKSAPKQNVSKKYIKMNQKNIELVRSNSKYDQEIYRHAINLNKKFKKENPNFNKIVKNMKYKRILMIPFSLNKQIIYEYSERLRKTSKKYGRLVDSTKETLKKFKIEI